VPPLAELQLVLPQDVLALLPAAVGSAVQLAVAEQFVEKLLEAVYLTA
jgi:hypothetical protein